MIAVSIAQNASHSPLVHKTLHEHMNFQLLAAPYFSVQNVASYSEEILLQTPNLLVSIVKVIKSEAFRMVH